MSPACFGVASHPPRPGGPKNSAVATNVSLAQVLAVTPYSSATFAFHLLSPAQISVICRTCRRLPRLAQLSHSGASAHWVRPARMFLHGATRYSSYIRRRFLERGRPFVRRWARRSEEKIPALAASLVITHGWSSAVPYALHEHRRAHIASLEPVSEMIKPGFAMLSPSGLCLGRPPTEGCVSPDLPQLDSLSDLRAESESLALSLPRSLPNPRPSWH